MGDFQHATHRLSVSEQEEKKTLKHYKRNARFHTIRGLSAERPGWLESITQRIGVRNRRKWNGFGEIALCFRDFLYYAGFYRWNLLSFRHPMENVCRGYLYLRVRPARPV